MIRHFVLICLICGNLWLIFLFASRRLCALAVFIVFDHSRFPIHDSRFMMLVLAVLDIVTSFGFFDRMTLREFQVRFRHRHESLIVSM